MVGVQVKNSVYENLRHVHGTNITKHIDLFEKLITQMSHNDPLHPPTEEQRIDWFLDSVTKRTYDAVQATCSEGNIDGTLIFNKMVKLFIHKCFQRYPEFQIKELVDSSTKSTITNNSTTTYDKRGRNNHDKGKGRGKRKGPQTRGSTVNRHNPSSGKGKGYKGRSKGKGKSPKPHFGNRNSEPCSYCGKPGHQNRECRKRQYDEKEKNKPTHTNNSQHASPLQVDETTMMFRQHAVFFHPSTPDNPDDVDNETHNEHDWEDEPHGDTNTLHEDRKIRLLLPYTPYALSNWANFTASTQAGCANTPALQKTSNKKAIQWK
jgi:hypothetical protein